jgi:predicted nucleic acid-binding protein
MDGTVDVLIPVDARAAGELRDTRTRDAIGRLVSRVLRRQRQENVKLLFAAIEQLGADAKDNKYLELALAADASLIVSSDQDLLVMDPWRGGRILLPMGYLEATGRTETAGQTGG